MPHPPEPEPAPERWADPEHGQRRKLAAEGHSSRPPHPVWRITLRLDPLDPDGQPVSGQGVIFRGRGRIDPGDAFTDADDGGGEWTLRWLDDPDGPPGTLTVSMEGE